MDILYLDFETSGLDPRRHSILQAAWIVERKGEVVSEKSFDVMAKWDADLCLAALETNGFTLERIKSGVGLETVMAALQRDLNGGPSLRPCGHNVQFDISFLLEAADACHTFLQFIDFKKILDTRSIISYMDYKGNLSLPNCKLGTVCEHYGIPLKAHDALEDVRAVRTLFHRISCCMELVEVL